VAFEINIPEVFVVDDSGTSPIRRFLSRSVMNVLVSYDHELGVIGVDITTGAVTNYLTPDEMRTIATALIEYANKIEDK